MKQTVTDAPAQTSPFPPRAAAATITDLIRPPLSTAGQYDHVAAAAYLMKHAGTTALMVTDAQTGQPTGIITEADVARAIADGKDLNDVRVHAVMITRPAITTTSSVRDAAKIMTASHYRHLPVADDAGLLGVIDITDVCQALNNAEEGQPEPGSRSGLAPRPGWRAHNAVLPQPGRRPSAARTSHDPRPPTRLITGCASQ